MKANFVLNNELNGIELYFDNKPEDSILTMLKENGFRWNRKKVCWYNKQSEKSIKLAQEITNGNITEVAPKTTNTRKKTKKVKKSLYERLQFEEGNTDKSKYNYKYVGSNYDEVANLTTKEIAKIIRKHLKERFPEVKFSITSNTRGWTSSIYVTIKESPYNYKQLEYNPELTRKDYQNYNQEHNKEILAIMDYCRKLLDSYNYDNSDSMTDYFDVGFYDSVSIDYNYKQTEQTEEIKKDIENYRNKLIEDVKAEEECKEREYQEYLKKLEKEKQREKEITKEQARQKEIIYNSINIVDLEEQEQYFVLDSQFAHLNKNNTLDEYKREVAEGEYYLQNVKITREIHFTNKKALEYFNNMLLHDFDFIKGTGGSYTEDNRISTMTDYTNMTKEERSTVEWLILGIAIYYNNKLQFVIDAQGFGYARYVGLVDNATITKDYAQKQIIKDEEVEKIKAQAKILKDISFNVIVENNLIDTWDKDDWKMYKNMIKEQLKANNIKLNKAIIQQLTEEFEELKVAMYKLLTEVNGIQEQFKEANLQQGQKITIFNISEFGFVSPQHITVEEIEPTEYAQYKDAIKLTFRQKGKRGLYYSYYYKPMLIYNGWIDIPKNLLYNTEHNKDFTITQSKYGSFDKKQYDTIIEYLAEQGHKPIINTYKPIF